ncbi:MAG: endonuclease Q family protein [Nanoarchaeota archaeon]
MDIIADLQIHSRFSRATSQNITIQNIIKYAKIKGINLIGTGDFTHPEWLKEIKQHFEEGDGILNSSESEIKFLFTGEVSNIYEQDRRVRKVHNLLFAPSVEIVEQINEHLSKRGNLESDGRPIFSNYTCPELVEDLKSISNEIEIIRAHAWTPYFSIFGSESGFDSVKECFQEQTKHVYAIETGLSSDPAMNWRLSQLDKYTLVSNSDAHSLWPWRLGREATLFHMKELDYRGIIKAIRNKEIKGTIEVKPDYGKYHLDGHRDCNVCLLPEETRKINKICPKCGDKVTVGVLHRVEELADRPSTYIQKDAPLFITLIPLSELISASLGKAIYTKAVWNEYNKLIQEFGNEYNILLKADREKIIKIVNEKLADAIIQNREGKIKIKPGYDGKYGEVVLEREIQKKLF